MRSIPANGQAHKEHSPLFRTGEQANLHAHAQLLARRALGPLQFAMANGPLSDYRQAREWPFKGKKVPFGHVRGACVLLGMLCECVCSNLLQLWTSGKAPVAV